MCTQLPSLVNHYNYHQAIPPNILLAGDFNLPGIHWVEGYSQIHSNPSYGLEVNHSLVDTVNDDLEQLASEPTRRANILNLLFHRIQVLPLAYE